MQEEAWIPLPDKKKRNRTRVTQAGCQNEYESEENYFSKYCTLKGTRNWIFSLLSHISLTHDKTIFNNNIIPRAQMGYESIAHKAEGRMGY